MRNYLRETIRQEVRHEAGHQTGHDGQRGAPGPEPNAEFRVVLRPITSSLPLGFFAFTVGTMLLTALKLRWVPVSETAQVAALVLAFVVPLEALSGLFAFLARDSGAATGLTTLSAAWAATAISLLHGPPGAHNAAPLAQRASRQPVRVTFGLRTVGCRGERGGAPVDRGIATSPSILHRSSVE